MLERGQRIEDRYVVERMLARGGMATVYVVQHEKLHSLHAVKILDISTTDIRRRLIQEGRLQASLKHPNIVAVTDAIEIDNQPALVMEYIDGPSLGKWLEDHEPTLEQAEDWFTQIVSAVAFAHARGLVHRDLKPDNVLLAPMSGTLMPKVADFGIAKVLAEASSEKGKGHTVTGIALGTPSYMPPEQTASAAEVDHRADVFALGCILYELVCGKQAFSGDSLLQVFARIADGDYEPPEKTVPGLPKRFVETIRGCLQPDVSQRITDCDTLMAVLRGEKGLPKAKPRKREVTAEAGSRSGFWLAAAGLGVGGVASVTAIAAIGALVVVMAGVAVGAWYYGRTSGGPFVVATAPITPAPLPALPPPPPGEPGLPARDPYALPGPAPFPGGNGSPAPVPGGYTAPAPVPGGHVAPVPVEYVPSPVPVEYVAPAPVPVALPVPRPITAPKLPLGRSEAVLGWVVTVHGARSAQRVSESVFKHAAEEGEQLVLVDVTVQRKGSADSPFFPSKVIGPWGDEYDATLACEMALPNPLDTSSTFEPGESRRGEACFHVPLSQKGLTFRFKPDLMSDDALFFALPL